MTGDVVVGTVANSGCTCCVRGCICFSYLRRICLVDDVADLYAQYVRRDYRGLSYSNNSSFDGLVLLRNERNDSVLDNIVV